jgi:hypothetical protein
MALDLLIIAIMCVGIVWSNNISAYSVVQLDLSVRDRTILALIAYSIWIAILLMGYFRWLY